MPEQAGIGNEICQAWVGEDRVILTPRAHGIPKSHEMQSAPQIFGVGIGDAEIAASRFDLKQA